MKRMASSHENCTRSIHGKMTLLNSPRCVLVWRIFIKEDKFTNFRCLQTLSGHLFAPEFWSNPLCLGRQNFCTHKRAQLINRYMNFTDLNEGLHFIRKGFELCENLLRPIKMNEEAVAVFRQIVQFYCIFMCPKYWNISNQSSRISSIPDRFMDTRYICI